MCRRRVGGRMPSRQQHDHRSCGTDVHAGPGRSHLDSGSRSSDDDADAVWRRGRTDGDGAGRHRRRNGLRRSEERKQHVDDPRRRHRAMGMGQRIPLDDVRNLLGVLHCRWDLEFRSRIGDDVLAHLHAGRLLPVFLPGSPVVDAGDGGRPVDRLDVASGRGSSPPRAAGRPPRHASLPTRAILVFDIGEAAARPPGAPRIPPSGPVPLSSGGGSGRHDGPRTSGECHSQATGLFS